MPHHDLHGELQPDSVREVYRGSLIRVEVESWPGGEREIVRHPGACGLVAITAGGEVVLVRQRREPVRAELLEIPAGIFDVEGESAAACAARELMEETGYRAENAQPLAAIYTSPGFTDERIELFSAEAVPEGRGQEEGVKAVLMPFAEAVSAVREGRIADAKTVAALLLTSLARPRNR